ncbi:flagellar biosynthesis anti-sigma factor FlgM [Silvibacterium dinghuense]|uniref:Flagellar biosynthesis anti-sigma factor FlgM n=1 Tax=Silvibacterium dinghuense TaxID=1560006 RepID=A0A4Q1SEE7_9BACT|nr:flagellar biosynthesis anti-sigma factor FlgM [Silvibacterium dinghuense]RXS95649.1 flagellar biosynthesis anti-sigma factor FlgM [Silvibacterium dinghuense]GGH14678.1 hypothetical protein GCM10011586_35260 [Silvibacterium dinghuense]
MKISGDFLQGGAVSGAAQAGNTADPHSAIATGAEFASASQATIDTASLSTAGTAASAASSTASEVRGEKVAAMQSALASGTYSVPSSEVAGKVIEHMLGGANG